MAAGILVALGKTLKTTQQEAHQLMDQVAEAIGSTTQRIYLLWLASACHFQGRKEFLHLVNNAIIQIIQLLDALDQAQHKDAVWSFFTAHMAPAIHKYQMGSQLQDEEEAREVGGLTAEQFEDYLIFACHMRLSM